MYPSIEDIKPLTKIPDKSNTIAIVADIDSFDKYVENVDRMEAFYANVCTESLLLEICLMEHAVTYAEFIMNSAADFGDKYDDLDELYEDADEVSKIITDFK